jgi:hypothetical protein
MLYLIYYKDLKIKQFVGNAKSSSDVPVGPTKNRFWNRCLRLKIFAYPRRNKHQDTR